MVYGRTEAEALAKQHQAENGGGGQAAVSMPTAPPELPTGVGNLPPRAKVIDQMAPVDHSEVATVATSPPRPRPVRITVDLDGPRYDRLRRWVNTTANEVNPDRGRLSLAAGIRAMIDAATADESIGLVVVDLLRRDQQR
jgi:hypothetical protein